MISMGRRSICENMATTAHLLRLCARQSRLTSSLTSLLIQVLRAMHVKGMKYMSFIVTTEN